MLNSFQSINSYTLDPSKTLNYCENVKLYSQNVITCAQSVSKYSHEYCICIHRQDIMALNDPIPILNRQILKH